MSAHKRAGQRLRQALRVLKAFELPPIPIHLVYPAGRHLPLKTRLFIDRATTALRGRFG